MIIGIMIFLALTVAVLITSASLLRCKKCRKWHECVQDEEKCEGPE